MANTTRPKGLVPVSYLNGSSWNGQARMYYIPASNTPVTYVGDPVKLLANSADANGLPSVVQAAAADALVGVVVGVAVATAGVSLVGASIDLTRRSLPTLTAGYVMVVDDPSVIFEAEEGITGSAAGTALTSAAIGNNIDFVVIAGANTYSDSGTLVDNSTEATTATLPLKLLGLVQREGNAYGERAKWLVKINNHQYGSHTGTAGI